MKFCHLCLIAIACLFAFSCEKVSIDSDTYTKYFDLVSDDVPGSYVDVVPTELLSKQYVEKHIVGYGWESVAIYKVDRNKDVIAEYEIIKDGPLSSSDNKEYVDMFEIRGFGVDCLIDYDPTKNVYELFSFDYDETTGKISLRCWHVGHNGKLVHLSDDVMVCVDSKDFTHTAEIYMVVFRKVSSSTLNDWPDQHPYELIWE